MSDRARRLAGTVLLLICIALCLFPAFTGRSRPETTYRTGGKLRWAMTPIETERNGTVRINEAYAEELEELNGIGETLSALIVEEREKNGPFHYAEDLEVVKGIGLRTLERFRGQIDLSPAESEE